jgi:hypothetical protein
MVGDYSNMNTTTIEEPNIENNNGNDIKESDCTYGEPVLENNKNIITKIEHFQNNKKIIKINTKLKEFTVSQIGEKYRQNIEYILEEPAAVELSTIKESLEKCSQTIQESESQAPKSEYYLCKYEDIGNRTLSEYIKEQPNIQRILDQHEQLISTSFALSTEKKLIHYTIRDLVIKVKTIDNIPVITKFKQSAFLYYGEEFNINNFNSVLTEATDIHCLEAHVLVYLGKKKEQLSQQQWNNTLYDQQQHTDATYGRAQASQSYPEYIDKTYEEVYQKIEKTFPKWDIYSIMVMISNILKDIQLENIDKYQSALTEILSKKTTDLPITVTEIIFSQPVEQLSSETPITDYT